MDHEPCPICEGPVVLARRAKKLIRLEPEPSTRGRFSLNQRVDGRPEAVRAVAGQLGLFGDDHPQKLYEEHQHRKEEGNADRD